MEQVVAGILCMLLVFVLFPLLWWRRRQTSASSHEHEDDPQPLQADRVVRQPRASRMRRRPVTAASSSVASTSTEDALIESDEDVLEDENLVAKASTKKEKKKQEREAQRQAEEASRESRKSKQDYYAEMRRKKDEEREAEERRMEEEAMVRKAKEEEAAALEFDKWKGEFSVDAEGTTTENEMQDEKQSLLSNFVEYIKKQKCVPLEDLAAEFKLRTQDCINRITTLESMGRLSGVMDDRGKYVYISPEEMKAVADYIKREGRVSISHLASQSNQFIDLDPKSQFEVEHGSEGITVS